MRSRKRTSAISDNGSGSLPKCPTGIHGLDEITLGGLPRGRPTLVCGALGFDVAALIGQKSLVRKLIGDLCDEERVLVGLDILPRTAGRKPLKAGHAT